MDDRDRELIAELYRTFAGYDRPATFRGCPCGGCWGTTEHTGTDDVIVASPGGDRPIDAVAESEITNLVVTVPGTSGDLALYKHYLPRMLELVAEGRLDNDWADAGRMIETLENLDQYGEVAWEQWPEAESRVIRRFLDRFITPEWRADWQDEEPN